MRNVASSIAESPPPTTTISLFLKKNPSHVAQYETPKPCSAFSLGKSDLHRRRAGGDDQRLAFVDVRVGRDRRTDVRCSLHALDLLHLEDGAEALGLLPHQVHQLRPEDPVGEAGIVFDVGGDGELPARLHAFEDERSEIGAGEIDRRRASGRAGSDDDHFVVCDSFHGGAHSTTAGYSAVLLASRASRAMSLTERREQRVTEENLLPLTHRGDVE